MPEFVDGIKSVLESAGVATFGTNLFISQKAVIPSGDGPYTHVLATGGTAPEHIQNEQGPSAQRPTAQILTYAANYTSAVARARAAYRALAVVRNQTVDGDFYREINPLQEPFELGLDENGRCCVAFNVIGTKQPA